MVKVPITKLTPGEQGGHSVIGDTNKWIKTTKDSSKLFKWLYLNNDTNKVIIKRK